MMCTIDIDKWHELQDSLTIELQNVEIDINSTMMAENIVISGDLEILTILKFDIFNNVTGRHSENHDINDLNDEDHDSLIDGIINYVENNRYELEGRT
jgi:hypothetical protein